MTERGTAQYLRQDGSGHIRLSWARAVNTARVHAVLDDGRDFQAADHRFDVALDELLEALPPGAAPCLCATCALGFLDTFGAANGFDDWSCYRGWPDLAELLHHHGKQAPAEAFRPMHKVPMRAVDVCDGYEARKRKGPL